MQVANHEEVNADGNLRKKSVENGMLKKFRVSSTK